MIRVAAKLIVFKEEKILLIEHRTKNDHWFTLPGGGAEKFESLKDAAIRECFEETGYDIDLGKCVCIRDYIGKNHEFKHLDENFHQVDMMFLANIKNQNRDLQQISHDKTQIGILWCEMGDFTKLRFFPKTLQTLIVDLYHGRKIAMYLGDVN